jgi:hypothetical protein
MQRIFPPAIAVALTPAAAFAVACQKRRARVAIDKPLIYIDVFSEKAAELRDGLL